MMKKTGLLAVLTAGVLLLAGCGGEAKTIDAQALAKSLATEIKYDDTLKELTADEISMLVDLPEDVDSVMYAGSGSTAEEVGVFTAKDSNQAKETMEDVQKYLDDQADSFQDYVPEETKRIGNAVLEQKNQYVVLCVSGDSDQAMVFSSFVFLLAFLPIVLLLYYLCPARLRNLVLLVFSLVFYAWGEPVYVLIMLFSIVFDYANGRLIEHFKNKNCPGKAKAALIVDLCGNLAILGFFKYTDFVIGSINSITGAGLSLLHIALPIGISFYTFQTMSYTIDVYRGEVAAQKNILTFATYVTLFPQLIAGPIVQYKTVEKELMHRKVTLEDFSEGAFRFSVGLAKKVLLANQIGSLWDSISQLNHMSVATAWLGAIAYSFQIYFDFSGYSDMAIGLGRMFGFYFLENFNFPYMSKTITEFWRRWHISLSSWFREYVYIPLGGNRKGLVRQLFNIMVVWMLTGLWHGANWNFVLWGVYYGVLLMIEKLFLLKWLDKLPNWIGHIYSMFLVVIGWTIFAQTDIHQLGEYLKTMFGIGHVAVADSDFLYFLGSNAVLLVALIAASIDYRVWMRRLKQGKDATIYDAIATSKGWTIAKPVLMVVFLLVSFAFLVGDSYNPFLYFRF